MTPSIPASAANEWRNYWPLVMVGAAGMALAATMNVMLGVMMVPIERELGWTRAEISSGAMIVSVMGILFAPAAGFAIDRLGARRVGLAVVVLMSGAMLFLASMADSLWHWWAGWAIYAIAGTATATVWLAPISARFSKGRGLALVLTLTGAGLSAAVIPVAANYLLEQGGWRFGYLGIGAIYALITIPLTYFFWRDTEDLSAASGTSSAPTVQLQGLSVQEAMRSRNFILIVLAQMIGTLASAALAINLIPILIEARISAGQAAAMAGAQGLAVTLGRFVGGWALDHYSAKWLVAGATLGSAALPIVLLSAPGAVTFAYAAVIFNGLMSSMRYPGMVYLLSSHVGARSFGTLFGVTSTAMSIAASISPVLANYVFDVTRSYSLVLWAVIPPIVIAAVLFASLDRNPQFGKS